jgi:hypothetical protein
MTSITETCNATPSTPPLARDEHEFSGSRGEDKENTAHESSQDTVLFFAVDDLTFKKLKRCIAQCLEDEECHRLQMRFMRFTNKTEVLGYCGEMTFWERGVIPQDILSEPSSNSPTGSNVCHATL